MVKPLLMVGVFFLSINSISADECVIGNGYHLIDDEDYGHSNVAGTWYPLYIHPTEFAKAYQCWKVFIQMKPDGSFKVVGTSYSSGELIPFALKATRVGKKSYEMSMNETPHFNPYSTVYHVLAADYNQFLLVGGCPKPLGGKPLILIYFRSSSPTEDTINATQQSLKKYGLKFSDFDNTCEDPSLHN
ncbi:hypothetical protein C0J52_17298 [Blattella germanica]|nr:hypothetical protein C0J52_17298 [Blattella germanica]